MEGTRVGLVNYGKLLERHGEERVGMGADELEKPVGRPTLKQEQSWLKATERASGSSASGMTGRMFMVTDAECGGGKWSP